MSERIKQRGLKGQVTMDQQRGERIADRKGDPKSLDRRRAKKEAQKLARQPAPLPYDEAAYLDNTQLAREEYRTNLALSRNADEKNLKDRGQEKRRQRREDKLSALGTSASDPNLSHAKKFNKPWEKANELFVDRYGKPFVDDTDEFLQKIMQETTEAPMFDK